MKRIDTVVKIKRCSCNLAYLNVMGAYVKLFSVSGSEGVVDVGGLWMAVLKQCVRLCTVDC